ncbi:hypothetical protein [uncultured Amnibacterium sp.]|uniref:hypothetical protein n=1 Tax=uncultured Amnibacterium sp. TaxID=1631851 RepID=UPI0035C970C9
MELLFIVLIGIVLGLIARAVLPGRAQTGVALLPALGGASAAVVWVALTWARLKWDQPLIWTLTLVAAALTVAGAGLLLARSRTTADERTFERVARTGTR